MTTQLCIQRVSRPLIRHGRVHCSGSWSQSGPGIDDIEDRDVSTLCNSHKSFVLKWATERTPVALTSPLAFLFLYTSAAAAVATPPVMTVIPSLSLVFLRPCKQHDVVCSPGLNSHKDHVARNLEIATNWQNSLIQSWSEASMIDKVPASGKHKARLPAQAPQPRINTVLHHSLHLHNTSVVAVLCLHAWKQT